MWKVFLLSIIVATIAVPAKAARTKNPKKGLKKAIVYMIAFNAFYYFTLLLIYGRL